MEVDSSTMEELMRFGLWLCIYLTILIIGILGYGRSKRNSWVWLIVFAGASLVLMISSKIYWEYIWDWETDIDTTESVSWIFSVFNYLAYGALVGACALFYSDSSKGSSDTLVDD